jgi:hypothetical protein
MRFGRGTGGGEWFRSALRNRGTDGTDVGGGRGGAASTLPGASTNLNANSMAALTEVIFRH